MNITEYCQKIKVSVLPSYKNIDDLTLSDLVVNLS